MKYFLRITVAVDQLINTMLGGYPTETISERASIEAAIGTPWACWLCRLMDIFDKGHCDLHRPSKSEQLSRGADHLPFND